MGRLRKVTPVDGANDLVKRLYGIVGRRNVLTRAASTARYRTGYRLGCGPVTAVVRPGSLVEQWRVLKACVATDHIVIVQAANTGLTGGSTPAGQYDRPVVIVNTLRITGVFPILSGEQVICLAGATLYELERVLEPLRREPHSVIGSSCIGASVVGGICNNSGGALVSRGPAYTQYALFAQVDEKGAVSMRNNLGVELGTDPEEILRALDEGRVADADVVCRERAASAAHDYGKVVRQVEAGTPARFNADPSMLFEASGSAGKIMVFAVRLDTFPRPERSSVFYIGSNDTAELTLLRRRILLDAPCLPVSGEYIHREAFDIAARYGKDTVLAIKLIGTDQLPRLFMLKAWVDRLGRAFRLLPHQLSDRLLQAASRLFPDHLPPRMRAFRHRFEHHLILKVADEGVEFARTMISERFPSGTGDAFECGAHEAERAMLHRFAVAGAAVRYRAVHADEVEDIVALDIALRRDERDWFERLPASIEEELVGKLYYGHFFCHVFHHDYLVRKGGNPVALEHRMHELLEARGAEFPAEHNVGHLYSAKPALAEHYRQLDPGNRFNPGIGRTSRARSWS